MNPRRLLRAYFRHRYAALFYTLIVGLGAAPLVAALGLDRNWIRLFLELNLFVAVFGFAPTRRSAVLRLGLAALVMARVLVFAIDHHTLAVATRPLVLGVGFAAAVGALAFALRTSRVDTEHVYAALDAYLLIGIFAGLLHHQIEDLWPGSYTSGGAAIAGFTFSTAIYFSFVTLATLGYGDIVPQTEVARGVTVVEAIIGQLYLAVLIARLVSNASRPLAQEGTTS
jgi:FtsH-binding integral membrane protein